MANTATKRKPKKPSAAVVRHVSAIKPGQIMGSIPVLRAMAEAGHITLRADTGGKVRHWTGETVTACYVRAASAERFEFCGAGFELRYIGGCFHPFIVRGGGTPPSFV